MQGQHTRLSAPPSPEHTLPRDPEQGEDAFGVEASTDGNMTFERHGVPPASGAAGATGLAYQSTGSAENDERLPQSSVDHVARTAA